MAAVAPSRRAVGVQPAIRRATGRNRPHRVRLLDALAADAALLREATRVGSARAPWHVGSRVDADPLALAPSLGRRIRRDSSLPASEPAVTRHRHHGRSRFSTGAPGNPFPLGAAPLTVVGQADVLLRTEPAVTHEGTRLHFRRFAVLARRGPRRTPVAAGEGEHQTKHRQRTRRPKPAGRNDHVTLVPVVRAPARRGRTATRPRSRRARERPSNPRTTAARSFPRTLPHCRRPRRSRRGRA